MPPPARPLARPDMLSPALPEGLAFHTLDVFTDTPYAGNPLAVVLGADDLSTAQMQTIAREFNLSETIFVRRPKDPAHTAEVRIFFPTAEIPFAGHPTIGCAVLLAQMAHGTSDWVHDITLEEQAGLVPVRVVQQGGVTRAEFVAPVLPHPHDGQAEPGACAAALGLSPAEIGFDGHAPGVWAGGPAFLYVPVASVSALARARPQEPGWSALMKAGGVDAAYLYTPDATLPATGAETGTGTRTATGSGYRARMFSPGAGIPEDPATGSASAILAAQLRHAGALGPGTTHVPLRQGIEMGRPSDIALRVVCAPDGTLSEVRIGGAAVRIGEGRLTPPPA